MVRCTEMIQENCACNVQIMNKSLTVVKNNNTMVRFYLNKSIICKSDVKKYKKTDGDSAFFT